MTSDWLTRLKETAEKANSIKPVPPEPPPDWPEDEWWHPPLQVQGRLIALPPETILVLIECVEALEKIAWQANYEAETWEASETTDEIMRVVKRITNESIRLLGKMADVALARLEALP